MQKHITNCPTEPLRWSLKSACREFEIHRNTLQRRLTEAGVSAGGDSLYSTHDILAAIHGDWRAQKLRKTREEADHVALKNAEARRELLPRQEVLDSMSGTFHAMRATILGSPIPQDLQYSLLKNLADITPPA